MRLLTIAVVCGLSILVSAAPDPVLGNLLVRGTVVRGQPNDIHHTYYYCTDGFVAPTSGVVFVLVRNGLHGFFTHQIEVVPGVPACPDAPCNVALPDGSCTLGGIEEPLESGALAYRRVSGLVPGAIYSARLVACDSIGFCNTVDIEVYEDDCP